MNATSPVQDGLHTETFDGEYPWASEYLSVDAGRLAYIDVGPKDAPALLMLHGNPTWSFYYRNLVKAFSATHRVIVPDHIGCGRSDKPEAWSYRLEDHVHNVGRLVDHLGLETLDLIVHDWGGAIGMGLAVSRPSLVRRFVVFNTAAFPSDLIPFSINLCRIPGFGALSIRGFNAFVRASLSWCIADKKRRTPALTAGYLAPYDSWANRVANLRFVQDIPMSASHPTHSVLVRIAEGLAQFTDHPMLIVWAAKDFVFHDKFFEEWKARFPKAETHYFEDAAHYVVEDAHERIVPLMKRFLEED